MEINYFDFSSSTENTHQNWSGPEFKVCGVQRGGCGGAGGAWACIGMKLNYSFYFNATKNTKTGPVQSPKCAEVSAVGLGVGWACIWDGINLFHYRYSKYH